MSISSQALLKKFHVLVIGGDRCMTGELQKGFSRSSFDVTNVDCPKEAVKVLSGFEVHLMIFDLYKYNNNLLHLLRNIREHQILSLVPRLGLIQASSAHMCRQWERDGISDFIFAPLDMDRVAKKAEYWSKKLEELGWRDS